jgi:hypothetical protein
MDKQTDKLDFDLEELERMESELKNQTRDRTFGTIIFIMIMLNSVLIIFKDLDFPSGSEPFIALLQSIIQYFIAFPMIGFFLALIPAVFPYKKLNFGRKYFNSFLWIMMGINGVALVINILLLIGFLQISAN